MKKILLKTGKGLGLTVGGLLLLLFLWPILFPGTAAEQIKQWTNENIEGELNFSKVRLSFFRQFPTLTLTLYDFSLTGSAPFESDTLLAGEALSFGLNLASLFEEELEVRAFYVDRARINVQVDEKGQANYNIYKGGSKADAQPDSSNTRLRIEGVFLNHCRLVYHDRSIPMRVKAEDFNYEGRGDLSNSQFDLESDMRAASFDFEYDGTAYFKDRKLQAELVTGINTASLVFRFAKNKILINQLPVDFSGEMAILKDGYDIDLNVVSGTTDFSNIFSALPPEYDQWFADTKFGGLSQIRVAMKGAYRAATAQAPDLSVNLWVRDGLIRHKDAPAPLEHFWINSTIQLPGLSPDSLLLRIDTLKFALNGAPTQATLLLKGLEHPYVNARLNSRLDLAMLDRALGLTAADLRGKLDVQLEADGTYKTALVAGRRQTDTVIAAIPAYRLDLNLDEGYLKLADFDLPLERLAARLHSECPSGRWQAISLTLDTLHAAIGAGSLSAHLTLDKLEQSTVTARLNAQLALEDLARAVPLAGYDLQGRLDASVRANGLLDAERQRFPAVSGTLRLQNGRLQTPYYPQPIEQIEANVTINGKHYQDIDLTIQPLAFRFEQQPFTLQARLENPADWHYQMSANGTLDLGKLYRVFAVEGYGVNGLLYANLEARGSESDATAGRYDRLFQKGTLRLKNLTLHSDDYPAPFLIPGSTLRFEQDKAWLSDAVLRYRDNSFTLNGYAQNFIGHVLGGSTLQGQLTVDCPRLIVDDFMVFAEPAPAAEPVKTTASAPEGVVLLPRDMNLTLQANAGEIVYGQTRLENFHGQVSLRDGALYLEQTQIGIAGATLRFNGNYTPVDERKARFAFQAKADSFDVQRAYREIPVFRELAGAAEKASGLISMEYQLEGRLNSRMEPVYPSIKGEGFLKLEHVNVKGLKLFGAVSKATGKDEINDPELKAVVMKSSIARNIITIERTKMKVLGFRPRIEGQASLDGRLNLRFRLGLPPFGLLGIPMTITGTSENPDVRIRKGKNGEELDEEADEEEEEGR